MERIRAAMDGLRAPTAGDRVYRDECAYTFTTPRDEGGLLVNMRTFTAVSPEMLHVEFSKVSRPGEDVLYLLQEWEERPVESEGDAAESAAEAKKLTTLGIGVEGGAALEDQVETIKHNFVLVYNGEEHLSDAPRFPLDHPDLPMAVADVARAILAHDDAARADEVQQAVAWEFKPQVSAHSLELPLADEVKLVSPHPKDWKCAFCDLTTPLWVNLSTGVVACGRRQPDGSGGNSHALKHYEDTGKRFPLCVKLGTITPSGADVYSYAPEEDDMVEDPKLAEHLARLGINIMSMQKTEKSMMELTLEQNEKLNLTAILENDKALIPAPGPERVGLRNLGNSCYANSVFQVLFSLPEVRQRFVEHASAILAAEAPDKLGRNLIAQMAKLGVALTTSKYVPEWVLRAAPVLPDDASEEEKEAHQKELEKRAEAAFVAPRMIRAVLGDGHPEFSTGRQQDAAEFFVHVLERIATAERAARDGPGAEVSAECGGSVGRVFLHKMELRTQCQVSKKVKYSTSAPQPFLALRIPLERAENKAEYEAYEQRRKAREAAKKAAKASSASAAAAEGGGGAADEEEEEPVAAHVKFSQVLDAWAEDEAIPDLYSPATHEKGLHTRRQRFATFPRYLSLVMQRYVVGDDWQPKKIDATIDMPDEIDLRSLRGSGLAPGEEEMPEDDRVDEGAAGGGGGDGGGGAEPSVEIVSALVGMGFSENAAKRAALAVDNASAEHASNWMFAHMEDPDLNDPLPEPGASASASASAAASGGGGPAFDPSAIAMVCAMGFSDAQARKALHETDGSAERAADWLLARMDELDTMDLSIDAGAASGGGGGGGGESGDGGASAELDDGEGVYELFAMISHIGRNTGTGHYVAHVKRDGRFVLFNDRKVAFSEDPPKGHAYMYFFRRKDSPTPAPHLFREGGPGDEI